MGRGIGMGYRGGKRPSMWLQTILSLVILVALAVPICLTLYKTMVLIQEQYERDKHSQAK